MIRRNTQTPNYWREPFKLNADDLSHLGSFILQKESPQSTDELSLALIDYRCQREEHKIRNELNKGELFQPRNHYEPGQQLVFPAFDYALGKVQAVRSGQNPEYGKFDVIEVLLEGETTPREFAASLNATHRLNRDADNAGDKNDQLQSVKQLFDLYGAAVRSALVEQLPASAKPAFVFEADSWLLRDMLTEIHVGHLNIAEAMIDMRARPVTTAELLTEIGLSADSSNALSHFSLSYALHQDSRFDDVGTQANPMWYLRRLQPAEAVEIPAQLKYEPISYDRMALGVELLQLEWEIGDEWTSDAVSVDVSMSAPNVVLNLIYPHLRAGTLPLSTRIQNFFPRGSGRMTMVTFVDGRWGTRFPAFVHHEGRYIAGLAPWYEQHKLPVGAIITLEKTRESLEYVVDFRPRRLRREWIRTAHVEDGNLIFQLIKQPITCEFDEHLALMEQAPGDLDEFREQTINDKLPLSTLVRYVTRELAGLSPQGTVHAKTIYSAINLIRRTPPGPIFANLASDSTLRNVGGGYWAVARA